MTMPRGFEGTFLRTMGRFSVCTEAPLSINKFIILVAYDELAEAADNPAVRAERACHFRNVARRCMLALLAISEEQGRLERRRSSIGQRWRRRF